MMIAIKFLLLILCAYAYVCMSGVNGQQNDIERIIGGAPAQRGQFPHIAALRLASGQTFCGAIIVTSQYVLTAAQCTTGPTANPQHIRVYVGAHTNSDGTMHRVNRIVRHPRYEPTTHVYNAALLRVMNPIRPVAGRVQLARLPQQDISERTTVRARIAGWGYTRVSGILVNFIFSWNSYMSTIVQWLLSDTPWTSCHRSE